MSRRLYWTRASVSTSEAREEQLWGMPPGRQEDQVPPKALWSPGVSHLPSPLPASSPQRTLKRSPDSSSEQKEALVACVPGPTFRRVVGTSCVAHGTEASWENDPWDPCQGPHPLLDSGSWDPVRVHTPSGLWILGPKSGSIPLLDSGSWNPCQGPHPFWTTLDPGTHVQGPPPSELWILGPMSGSTPLLDSGSWKLNVTN